MYLYILPHCGIFLIFGEQLSFFSFVNQLSFPDLNLRVQTLPFASDNQRPYNCLRMRGKRNADLGAIGISNRLIAIRKINSEYNRSSFPSFSIATATSFFHNNSRYHPHLKILRRSSKKANAGRAPQGLDNLNSHAKEEESAESFLLLGPRLSYRGRMSFIRSFLGVRMDVNVFFFRFDRMTSRLTNTSFEIQLNEWEVHNKDFFPTQ